MTTDTTYELHLARVFDAYAQCALWASCDDAGNPLDDRYDVGDIERAGRREMRSDCAAFMGECSELISELISEGWTDPWDLLGHDFWLTRNRHGAGFWDRGLGAIGEKLSDAAHAYGSQDLYVGDDGRVYVA